MCSINSKPHTVFIATKSHSFVCQTALLKVESSMNVSTFFKTQLNQLGSNFSHLIYITINKEEETPGKRDSSLRFLARRLLAFLLLFIIFVIMVRFHVPFNNKLRFDIVFFFSQPRVEKDLFRYCYLYRNGYNFGVEVHCHRACSQEERCARLIIEDDHSCLTFTVWSVLSYLKFNSLKTNLQNV